MRGKREKNRLHFRLYCLLTTCPNPAFATAVPGACEAMTDIQAMRRRPVSSPFYEA